MLHALSSICTVSLFTKAVTPISAVLGVCLTFDKEKERRKTRWLIAFVVIAVLNFAAARLTERKADKDKNDVDTTHARELANESSKFDKAQGTLDQIADCFTLHPNSQQCGPIAQILAQRTTPNFHTSVASEKKSDSSIGLPLPEQLALISSKSSQISAEIQSDHQTKIVDLQARKEASAQETMKLMMANGMTKTAAWGATHPSTGSSRNAAHAEEIGNINAILSQRQSDVIHLLESASLLISDLDVSFKNNKENVQYKCRTSQDPDALSCAKALDELASATKPK